MKTKLFYILMTFIFIGMVISAFAVSPDKDKGDKTKPDKVKIDNKTDNLTPSLLPPPSWTLRIHVMDTATCGAQDCPLGFLIQPATASCHVSAAIPPIIVPYYKDQPDYNVPISDDIPCVVVSIIVLPGYSCSYPFNSNTCCECQDNNNVCKLYICP